MKPMKFPCWLTAATLIVTVAATTSALSQDKKGQESPKDKKAMDASASTAWKAYMTPNENHKVLDGKVGQSLLDELGKHGLKGLAYFENGWRALTNNKRPVVTPEDAKGLKLRSTPNPYHLQAFRVLGMNPSPLPISELYSALETRAFDAQEHPIPVLWSSKFYEVQKFLTVTNHAYSPIVAAMNKGKFDGMPPAHQQAIVDSAREAAAYHRDLNMKEARTLIEGLKKAGMQVVEQPDLAPFRKIVYEPVRSAFVEKNGVDLIDAIEAEK